MCIWIRTAKAELVKDMTFLKLLHELQDLIAEDGLANHLTSTLADSIKESAGRSGGLASSPILPLKVCVYGQPHPQTPLYGFNGGNLSLSLL